LRVERCLNPKAFGREKADFATGPSSRSASHDPGQKDSPFLRRVGIALTLHGLPFIHRPWSVFGDAEKIQPCNPLIRVPILVLDNAEVLTGAGEAHRLMQVPIDAGLVSSEEFTPACQLPVMASPRFLGEV